MRKIVIVSVGVLCFILILISLIQSSTKKTANPSASPIIPTVIPVNNKTGYYPGKGTAASSSVFSSATTPAPFSSVFEAVKLKNKGKIEEQDFVVEYAPNLDKFVVTKKNERGEESWITWARENGYSPLVDNINTTIVSDKTMQEVQTPYTTKTPEQQIQVLTDLFSLLLQPPVFPTSEPTSVPTSVPSSSSSSSSSTSQTGCSGLDEKLSKYTFRYTSGYTGYPRTNNQIFNFDGTKNYSIPYRNENCTVSESSINKAYEKIKTFYPGYWQNSQLLTHWKLVQEKSKKYHLNPVFVISLWLEESAAGGAKEATQFGCDFLRNPDGTFETLRGKPSDICTQMQCLFVIGSINPKDYVEFACSYQYGSEKCVSKGSSNCYTCAGGNPNFVKTVNFWYEFLSSDLPAECKTKYCPGIDGCN